MTVYARGDWFCVLVSLLLCFQKETTESYRVENCTQVSSRKIGKWKKRRLQKVSQLHMFITSLHNHRVDVCHTVADFLVHHITTQSRSRCLSHSSRLPAVYAAKPLLFPATLPKGRPGMWMWNLTGLRLAIWFNFPILFFYQSCCSLCLVIFLLIIIIIKRISRVPIYRTWWEHRVFYNNTNHTHTYTHACTHTHTHTHTRIHTHTHTHVSDRGTDMAVKNSSEIVIKQMPLEGGFKRGGRIRVAVCLRQWSILLTFFSSERWGGLCQGVHLQG